MKKKKLSALRAIQEVSRLSAKEARTLVELYDLGVNGQCIRDHRREHDFTAWNFDVTLRKMITNHNLSLAEALNEMKGLCNIEWKMLAAYYSSGLRAETLRSLRGDISPSVFVQSFSQKPEKIEDLRRLYRDLDGGVEKERRDYLAAVIKADFLQGKNWEQILTNAAHEARLIKDNSGVGSDVRKKLTFDKRYNFWSLVKKSQRVFFLNRHLHEGVRAQDVPEVFSKHHLDTHRILCTVHHLSTLDALKEMAGLNEEQVQLLRAHYKAGVRCHELAAYPHPAKQTQELLKYFDLPPGNGLQNLAALNSMQFTCLSVFATHGLTISEAKQLQGAFNQLKQEIIMELINRGMKLYTALENTLPRSDEDAAKLLQEPLLQKRSQML